MAIDYSHTGHSVAAINKHNFYRGADCMKKLCADSRKYTTEIIYYEKKEMLSLTDEEIESYIIIKNSATSAKKSFMMLVIAMMIRIMKNLAPDTW